MTGSVRRSRFCASAMRVISCAAALAAVALAAPQLQLMTIGFDAALGPVLKDGDIFCPKQGDFKGGFSIACEGLNPKTDTVTFSVNGKKKQVETLAPYLIHGDRFDGYVKSWLDYPDEAEIICESDLGEKVELSMQFSCEDDNVDPVTVAPKTTEPSTSTSASATTTKGPAVTSTAASTTSAESTSETTSSLESTSSAPVTSIATETTLAPSTTSDGASSSAATSAEPSTTATDQVVSSSTTGVTDSTATIQTSSTDLATTAPVSSNVTSTVVSSTNFTTTAPLSSNATTTVIPSTNFTTSIPTSSTGNFSTTVPSSTNFTTSNTTSSTTIQTGGLSVINIDAGGDDDPTEYVSGQTFAYGPVSRPIDNTPEDSFFETHRYGQDFTYLLPLEPGTYEVTLGFAETVPGYCAAEKRVFSVYVDGVEIADLQSIDVFAEVGACDTALIKSVEVDIESATGMSIQFQAITADAFVSTINVASTDYQCIPESTTGFDAEDHRAHSVPGEYPPQTGSSPSSYIDADGDGFETVLVDGFKSHSHFQDTSDPDNPIPGEIRKWKWTDLANGEVLSEEMSFSYDFPLGTTRLILEVVDNTCDKATAETTVTVTSLLVPGKTYCYYYEGTEWPQVGGPGSEDMDSKPFYAAERDGFSGELPLPPGFESEAFAAKCEFFYESSESSESTSVSVEVDSSSEARVYEGEKLLLDSATLDTVSSGLAAGLHGLTVTYLRGNESSSPPQLGMAVNGTSVAESSVSFDRETVQPILASVEPESAPLGKEITLLVRGYGFYILPSVQFGELDSVDAEEDDFSSTTFKVKTPVVSSPGTLNMVASTPQGGFSNALPVPFGEGSVDEVSFTTETVLQGGSTALNFGSSCIAIWGDSWYMGTLGGRVYKVTVDADYNVVDSCISETFSNPDVFSPDGSPANSDILGIAFAPNDNEGKPYITTQALYWHDRNYVDADDMTAWRNGRILRLKPGGGCLELDEVVVTGLPISDHDHGANGMTFDQDGDLYVSVGGFTNAGLPGEKFGNRWEAPLSASILRVKLSLGAAFDGNIVYDGDLPDIRTANYVSGDVETFATGVRNGFDITFTSQGEMFATDNSLNASPGNIATSCNISDPGAPAFNRRDKVMKIVEGGYYGHPHLSRGECQFIDPYTGLDVESNPPQPELNYVAPLTTLPSSMDGIIEYTASHFGGLLKGELIVASFSPGGVGPTFRMKPNGQTQKLNAGTSGLTVAQGHYGELVFPRVKTFDFAVLAPDYTAPTSLSARVVTPFRGGKGGGLVITVTGHGFGSDPQVSVDGKECELTAFGSQETSRGSILKCVTPPAAAGAELVDVEVAADGEVSVIEGGFMYSRV